MKKIFFALLCFCCFFSTAIAGVIKGKITDEKNLPLPFATVYIEGTTIGTSANAEGAYMLPLPVGTNTVNCQFMGYTKSSFTLTVTGDETITHHFRLQEQTMRMKEHVVKASEDPALYIMRKVIAKRKFHAQQISTFETGIYLKGAMRTRTTPDKIMGIKVDPEEIGVDSMGKGILYLCEEEATYYTQGGKTRTVIHAVRESGNPNGMGFSRFPGVVRFYDNNIDISESITPRGMISPVSDQALNYYRYKLEGDFQEGGNTIYKITVTPRRQFEPLFTGTLYIVDELWNIHSLHMTATQTANIQLLDTLRIEQLFLPLKPDCWVIQQQTIFITLKIFGFDLAGGFVTVYSDQQVNHTLPDTIFNKRIVSVYDHDANKKDTTYWSASRPIPLEEEEAIDFIIKDSISHATSDPAYLDSLRRRRNKHKLSDLLIGGISHTGKEHKYFFSTNAVSSGMVNYNTVEGLNISPQISGYYRLDSSRVLQGALATRYGFSNTRFNTIGKITYLQHDKTWRGRNWGIGLEAGKYVFQFNPNNPIEPFYNSIATLFSRRNYLKIHERAGVKAFFKRNYGNGLKWDASAGFQQRTPLLNTTDFSFAKENTGGFTDNFPPEFAWIPWQQHNAVLLSASISWQPGYTYVQYPGVKVPRGSDWPIFTFSYKKGVPDILDSKIDFDKWDFNVAGDMSLKLAGILRYNLSTGGFLNDRYVSIPDLNHIHGNQIIIATPYVSSFQTAPYYLYSNQAPLFGEAHLEWQLKGLLTNKIPLFRRLAWYMVAGGNAYYTDENRYHCEAFVGLDNIGYRIFRFLRVDFVQSWNSLQQQTSAIRIGISLNGVSIRRSGSEEEWK